ncbi:MAG TPA: YfbK domain-containing protein [Chthoniobacterales bacterium]|nr:YfbK domain-containing protein [Chthoniobacterales bacterium]
MKGRERANSEADTGAAPTRPLKIAREVKVQVEFNPAKVASYHLIGYEQEMPGKERLNRAEIDMGEIDAAQTVTAFFEL